MLDEVDHDPGSYVYLCLFILIRRSTCFKKSFQFEENPKNYANPPVYYWWSLKGR